METAIQRVPLMHIKSKMSSDKSPEEGVEWYRKILTETGDKPIAHHLHQKLSRQLAEVLLRGVPDGTYSSPRKGSQAVEQKANSLRLYFGQQHQYYCPESRQEEVLLVLSISEALAARETVLSRAPEDDLAREESLMNVKAVQNLLTLVLSSLRQYHLLAGLLEKAMKFAYEDRFIWLQFALSLMCLGKWRRSAQVLDECINQMPVVDEDPVQHMLAAKLCIEHLAQYDKAIVHADQAIALCRGGWLTGRAALLKGLAFSLKTQMAGSFNERKCMHEEALMAYETAVTSDRKDHLAEFFLALQLAAGRDIEEAQVHVDRSLEMQPDQPTALMLLALLLTAKGCLKEAREVTIDALEEFPSHYGLLVLRLKLDIAYNKTDYALASARDLLQFWKRAASRDSASADRSSSNEPPTTTTLNGADATTVGSGLHMTIPAIVSAHSGLVSSTVGSSAQLHAVPSMSAMDLTDKESLLGGTGGAHSEYGGAASTISDSIGLTTSATASSGQRSAYARFRVQANIWLELAELFLSAGKILDVQMCVDEACQVFPNSHQALYLKGRLLHARACSHPDHVQSVRLYSDAKSCFLGSLSIFPNHIPSLRQLAVVYQSEKNFQMAEKVLKDLIRIEPLDHESWQLLGLVLAESGRFDASVECLGTAGELEQSAPIMPFSVIPRILHV